MQNFGEFLYKLRKEKGMTQSQIADILGITDKAVSRWENGESLPETANLLPLSKALGVTVDELLSGGRKECAEKEEEKHSETQLKNRANLFSDDKLSLFVTATLFSLQFIILIFSYVCMDMTINGFDNVQVIISGYKVLFGLSGTNPFGVLLVLLIWVMFALNCFYACIFCGKWLGRTFAKERTMKTLKYVYAAATAALVTFDIMFVSMLRTGAFVFALLNVAMCIRLFRLGRKEKTNG